MTTERRRRPFLTKFVDGPKRDSILYGPDGRDPRYHDVYVHVEDRGVVWYQGLERRKEMLEEAAAFMPQDCGNCGRPKSGLYIIRTDRPPVCEPCLRKLNIVLASP